MNAIWIMMFPKKTNCALAHYTLFKLNGLNGVHAKLLLLSTRKFPISYVFVHSIRNWLECLCIGNWNKVVARIECGEPTENLSIDLHYRKRTHNRYEQRKKWIRKLWENCHKDRPAKFTRISVCVRVCKRAKVNSKCEPRSSIWCHDISMANSCSAKSWLNSNGNEHWAKSNRNMSLLV